MTDHRHNYLLWTAVTRNDDATAFDGAGRLSYVFPDVETEIEQMAEAVLTESVAEPSVDPRPRGGAAAPVKLSVAIPMLDKAHGIGRLFGALEESLTLAGCSYEITCVDDRSGTRHWRGCSRISDGNRWSKSSAFPCVHQVESGRARR